MSSAIRPCPVYLIADDSDAPDFKGDGARQRSERSPGWFAKDETGQLSIVI